MAQIKLTILSPCYNGEEFIAKYFENILEQTFKAYEIIIVNDGSSDNSDSVIRQYKKIFEDKGIVFKYLNKTKNQGHAKAINDGLKLVEGQYLMWPDIDDHMHPTHLEKHVAYMEEHEDVDLAIGRSAVFNIENLNEPLYYAWDYFPKTKQELIKKFIYAEGNNIGFMSGTFIVKTNFLWSVYKNKDIYSDILVGPTIQMVFPSIYLGKTGYIDECTFDYYIHGSNQHIVNERRDSSNYSIVYENVVDQLNIKRDEAIRIKKMARNVTNRLHLSYALKQGKKEIGDEAWNRLKADNGIRAKELLKYIILNIEPLRKLYVKLF